MNIRGKIRNRLDSLEILLIEAKHLDPAGKLEVEVLIESISKFWSVLSDADRDFVGAARHAIAQNLPWR